MGGWRSGFAARYACSQQCTKAARRRPLHAWEATMKKLLWLTTALALFPLSGFAQSTDDLNNAGKNPDNVVAHSMGLHRQSHSALKLINKSNVKKLVPVWNFSL